ncbi:MAG: hypothetical protein ABI880_02575 [Acidobacteriota bacterium]
MSRQTLPTRRQFARHLLVAGGAGVALACATPSQARDGHGTGDATQQAAPGVLVIDHLTPRPDFVGTQPQRFEWTAAAGVDRYAVGIWNDVDRLMWRDDRVAGAAVSPTGLHLDPGTYYWVVTGVRDDREIADSGRAAFVVED